MFVISQLIVFLIDHSNGHNTLPSRFGLHNSLSLLYQSRSFSCQHLIILIQYILFPFLETKIIKFLMFDSPNNISNMFTKHSQVKILLTFLLMLEKGMIPHESYEDLTDVKLTLNDSSVALEKLLNGLFLASDCGEV